MEEAARSLGVNKSAIWCAASHYEVRFPQKPSGRRPVPVDEIRARWAEILPTLKENLRREINMQC